jgi:hypothetical protein
MNFRAIAASGEVERASSRRCSWAKVMIVVWIRLLIIAVPGFALATSPDALALVHEWGKIVLPNGFLDYFRRSAIENLASELRINDPLATMLVDRFVVPEFQANLHRLEESLAVALAAGHDDAEIRILLHCMVAGEQAVANNQDPRSLDCAPAALKEKVAAREANANTQSQAIMEDWYLSTREAALARHAEEIRALGVDLTQRSPVVIPIPKAVILPSR